MENKKFSIKISQSFFNEWKYLKTQNERNALVKAFVSLQASDQNIGENELEKKSPFVKLIFDSENNVITSKTTEITTRENIESSISQKLQELENKEKNEKQNKEEVEDKKSSDEPNEEKNPEKSEFNKKRTSFTLKFDLKQLEKIGKKPKENAISEIKDIILAQTKEQGISAEQLKKPCENLNYKMKGFVLKMNNTQKKSLLEILSEQTYNEAFSLSVLKSQNSKETFLNSLKLPENQKNAETKTKLTIMLANSNQKDFFDLASDPRVKNYFGDEILKKIIEKKNIQNPEQKQTKISPNEKPKTNEHVENADQSQQEDAEYQKDIEIERNYGIEHGSMSREKLRDFDEEYKKSMDFSKHKN
jgi:hypothetical protein